GVVGVSGDLGGGPVEGARQLGVPAMRRGERDQEQGAGVANARRREVLLHSRFRTLRKLEDPVPAAAHLFDLERHRDAVQTVMLGQGLDDLVVLDRETSRLCEVRRRTGRWNRKLVDVGYVVWVADLVLDLQPLLRP